MKWNWQKPGWPQFTYKKSDLDGLESAFLLKAGHLSGSYNHLSHLEQRALVIDLMSAEALKTSEIEGEFLNRESLLSSIRHQFGLEPNNSKIPPAEQGIAEMLVDLYRGYSESLNEERLFSWHKMVTRGRADLADIGRYRTDESPMQVVSGAIYNPVVHFEAPPSKDVPAEMKLFLEWFNKTGPRENRPLPPLARAGLAHIYFVSIHPFEDGNGRLGRAISEKALSQSIGQPTLIALSETINAHRKQYYTALENNNKEIHVTDWVVYFAKTILLAQERTQLWIDFLIEKTKFFDRFKELLNPRQQKAVLKMFQAGPEGFIGGLSAEKYIRMTKTSRATATRDLQNLVEKGALLRRGELKHTRYCLAILSNQKKP